MATVLHDVVEDTKISLTDLQEMDFPHEVIEAVDALTKRGGESQVKQLLREALNKS